MKQIPTSIISLYTYLSIGLYTYTYTYTYIHIHIERDSVPDFMSRKSATSCNETGETGGGVFNFLCRKKGSFYNLHKNNKTLDTQRQNQKKKIQVKLVKKFICM